MIFSAIAEPTDASTRRHHQDFDFLGGCSARFFSPLRLVLDCVSTRETWFTSFLAFDRILYLARYDLQA
jgi:hypothetical protein